MHSPAVSILARSGIAHASTDRRQNAVMLGGGTDPAGRYFGFDFSELAYVTTGCGSSPKWSAFCTPVDTQKERNESASSDHAERLNSNRKETRKAADEDLLKHPNTSGIRLFADPQRQSSAGADEVVMDRSAEGAARGSDAV